VTSVEFGVFLLQGPPLSSGGGKEEGSRLLLGYCLIAAGVLDILAGFFFLFGRPIADDRTRITVVRLMAFSGVVLVALGILLALGTLG